MSTKVKQSSGSSIVLPEPGSYPAICYGLVFIGTVDDDFKGVKRKIAQVQILWELSTEKAVFGEGESPRPFGLNKIFTNSSSERGNLFKWLSSWSPKITKENFHKVDLADILGKACLISIIHKPSKKDASRIYLQPMNVSALPKQMEAGEQTNPSFIFDVEEFNQEHFNRLPNFIRDKIVGSEEFKASNINAIEVEAIARKIRGESTDSTPIATAEEAEKQITGSDNVSKADSDEEFF